MKIKISKNNNIITTVEEWYQFAPPKAKGKHWKDGRSAKSLAQFMTDKNQVKKLEDILVELEYNTKGVISCTPEANTVLPCKGNGRNHDLLMIGEDFVVGIEAKVSEPFSEEISTELIEASDNKKGRIDKLANELFGCKINEVKDGLELRYHLLTGVYGTLLEAENNQKSKALFLVVVFTDGLTSEDENAVNRNNDDFKNFCQQIGLSAEGGTICKSNVDLTIMKVEISLKSEI